MTLAALEMSAALTWRLEPKVFCDSSRRDRNGHQIATCTYHHGHTGDHCDTHTGHTWK